MILKLKQKLLRFRSEMHMGQYEKALIQGELILGMLTTLNDSKIDLREDKILVNHIAQQLKLVSEIQKMIKGSQIGQKKQKSKQEIQGEQQINPSAINNQSQANQTGKMIGKWNKKKQGRSPQKIKTSSYGFMNSNLGFSQSMQYKDKSQQKKQKRQEIRQKILLDEDECQILQRQVILPINLPAFFKNKEAHRLIVCHYQKCDSLIKKLTSQLTLKKTIIQLQGLQIQIPKPSVSKLLKIYICPLQNNRQKQIRQLLEDQSNILVLYSDKDRQILTQRHSNIKKMGYELKF